MKPFAIRSLGLGVAFMTLIQLPAVASSVFANKAAQSVNENTPASGLPAQPQLLAVALTTRSLGTGSQGADVRVLQRYLSREGL
ncbi:MAG: hypothetical protein AAGL17_24495, partial [Cyanobacteria bacterium J06576_12]